MSKHSKHRDWKQRVKYRIEREGSALTRKRKEIKKEEE